ncbi:N-methyl-L-tryptophan oxidase [Paraburkholderia humisilvae]|uniref:Monomeric sarcosine oxidase n=1 Tax=Paraburkholderia humisilvae TaxID=627669 RepID=A0A6J5CWX5_9BURK|nr:N-methyl-L-tryptophan oxidase [Paraburkholderia humisilvae]CAB3745677.1 Monomeric sarcosine oxidase [Paraburkholderia humisilvae]
MQPISAQHASAHDLKVGGRAFDTLIVGAGSMGIAAGYYLSKAGNKVLLLDAGVPPHEAGAHHGSTRLIRHAYGEGAGYVPLALRAQQLWLELEQHTGANLFARTGITNIGKAGDTFLQEVQRSAVEHGLPLETLDGPEASKRWPAWRLADNHVVSFEPDAGVLYCERAIRGYRDLAASRGATLRTNTRVASIELHGQSSVSVVTDNGERFTGRDLIVCAGKWTRPLLASVGFDIPVTRVRKSFAWFESAPNAFTPDVFPGFIAGSDVGQFYGFPDLEGSGFKIGRHDAGEPVAVDADLAPFGDEATDLSDLQAFLRLHLPGVGAMRRGRVCEYDMTPDTHFIIDRLPASPNVQIAAGFSGHGFKFASAIGEALAERITQGASRVDLSMFTCQRFEGPRG